MKKGVELSMNVIIIAAIGLLVLVILAVLVINASGKTQGALKGCNVQGGICQQSACGAGQAQVPANDCTGSSGTYCCRIAATG